MKINSFTLTNTLIALIDVIFLWAVCSSNAIFIYLSGFAGMFLIMYQVRVQKRKVGWFTTLSSAVYMFFVASTFFNLMDWYPGI